MGYRNAERALSTWGPRLGRHHAGRVALVVMAMRCPDRDGQLCYFAGWQPIAQALGLQGTERTRLKRVGEVLATLREYGAITEHPGEGRRRRWLLHLTTVPGNEGPSADAIVPGNDGPSTDATVPETPERQSPKTRPDSPSLTGRQSPVTTGPISTKRTKENYNMGARPRNRLRSAPRTAADYGESSETLNRW